MLKPDDTLIIENMGGIKKGRSTSKARKGIIWLLTSLVFISSFTGCSARTIQDISVRAEINKNDTDLVKATKTSSELKVHFIDVGQRDSIFIQSGNHDMLVDAGENDQGDTVVCGMGNSYGHPHQETTGKLSAKGIQIFRTDEQGIVIATSNGTDMNWNTRPGTSGKTGKKNEEKVPEKTVAPITASVPVTEAPKNGLTYVH